MPQAFEQMRDNVELLREKGIDAAAREAARFKSEITVEPSFRIICANAHSCTQDMLANR